MERERKQKTPEEQAEMLQKRREYFREYMRKRYASNPEKARAYKKTTRLLKKQKKEPSINSKEAETFGVYLADVVKLRGLLSQIPKEMLTQVLDKTTSSI